jgi:steroid 5-alpha reductase family enzyme
VIYLGVFGWCALAIVGLMVGTWVVSLTITDVSIVDPVWGLGFVVVAWVARVVADGHGVPLRQNVLVALTTVWGLRLFVHLVVRHRGAGEDFRYQRMRRRHGDAFRFTSLYRVFAFQGVMMFVVSMPVQVGQVPDHPSGLGLLGYAGVVVWAVGLGFEAVGDWQLTRFRRDPTTAGTVLDTGLWRYTRHPNYFGDACVWWGLFLIAAATGVGALTVLSPVVMTVLLMRVSGVPMLEHSLRRRRAGYDDYIARTRAFVPRRPRPPRSA